MVNLISITEHADDSTLVLLDELGSGTDPIEGSALAISIIEHIRKKGSIIGASTHYSEIKTYAVDTLGVENASCEFDLKTLRPTYKFMIGVPGSSNAFRISERLGLSKEIIEYSQQILDDDTKKLEYTLQNLEKIRMEIEEDKRSIEKLKNDAQAEQNRQAELRMYLEKDYKNQQMLNQSKANQILEQVARETQQILDELENEKKSMQKNQRYETLKSTKTNIYQKIDKVTGRMTSEKKVTETALERIPKIGEEVKVIDFGKKAVVLSLPDKNDMIQVSIGIIKTKTSLRNIKLIENNDITIHNSSIKKSVASKMDRTIKSEIDVRGTTVEEAMLEIDQFIDQNVLAGAGNISIIHGKGTGALRKGIHQHLRRHKCVRTYRLGVYGEGEDGVTILELK